MTKKPSYRFEGYTESWVEKKLGEVGETKSGVGFPDSEQGGVRGIPFYKVSDMNNIGNEIEMVTSNNYVTQEQIDSRKWKVIDTVPAIMFAKVGAALLLNRKRLIREPFLIDNNTMAYIPSAYWDTMFCKILFDTLNLSKYSQVGALPSYNGSDIEAIQVSLPSLPEQTAIGSFFQDIDQLISLQQRKLEVLKEQKKTYLKLLFPARGQTKPALRFAGFEDDWKEVKLGEVGETYTGLSGKTKEDFGHGEGKFITYVNVFNNPLTDLYGLDSIEIDDKQRRVQYGDVLFTTSSETPEDVGLSSVWMGTEDNVYLNSFCFGYRPQKGIFDLYYLAFVLRSFSVRREFMLLAQGISRFNISKTKVMDMFIHVPSLPEQEAIGSFFQDLDKAIAKQEEKVNQLKESKQTLLRKMFI